MTWEQVYNELTDAEKVIMDMVDDNRIDLCKLANLHMHKIESEQQRGEL